MLGGKLAVLVCAGVAASTIGACGGSEAEEPDGIRTDKPEVTFAPVVQLAREESYRPMDALWFLQRSALWLAQEFCPDSKIAVGKRLKDQWNGITDWLFIYGIGWGPSYWRQMYTRDCDFKRQRYRYYANEYTRPRDGGEDRAKGLYPREGYYLDLMDWARGGPAETAGAVAPVWYERRRIAPDGQPGLRLTYWMLYGMNRPLDGSGRPVEGLTHEGDWERVDVLLTGEKGRYRPIGMDLFHEQGPPRRVPWSALRRTRGERAARATHPVLYAARGSHALYASPGRHRGTARAGGSSVTVVDRADGACPRCIRWTTWDDLVSARTRAWYGFGGAWGKPGPTDETTGPLGPHGEWPTDDPRSQHRHTESRPRA
jgi:hypothetical protein